MIYHTYKLPENETKTHSSSIFYGDNEIYCKHDTARPAILRHRFTQLLDLIWQVFRRPLPAINALGRSSWSSSVVFSLARAVSSDLTTLCLPREVIGRITLPYYSGIYLGATLYRSKQMVDIPTVPTYYARAFATSNNNKTYFQQLSQLRRSHIDANPSNLGRMNSALYAS